MVRTFTYACETCSHEYSIPDRPWAIDKALLIHNKHCVHKGHLGDYLEIDLELARALWNEKILEVAYLWQMFPAFSREEIFDLFEDSL
jgi:D-alanine-D-alanine ligase-like ATP-grasp enzyme